MQNYDYLIGLTVEYRKTVEISLEFLCPVLPNNSYIKFQKC